MGVSAITCADCQALLPDFCRRLLNRRLERKVVSHLRRCDICLRQAEQVKTNHSPAEAHSPTVDQEMIPDLSGRFDPVPPQRIDQTPMHHRSQAPMHRFGRVPMHRLGQVPMHRIGRSPIYRIGQALVRAGVVLVLILAVFSFTCHVYGNVTHDTTEEHVRLWAELRYPRAELGSRETDWSTWWPFYRREGHYPLLQWDGGAANERIGTVMIIQRGWKREIDVHLDASVHSPMLRVPGEGGGRDPELAWEALEQLPSFVHVEVAFSVRHAVTPQALEAMLERYELDAFVFYVYSGESPNERKALAPLELNRWLPHSGSIPLERSERMLRERLRAVAAHPVRKEERRMWEERLAYVETNGLHTYGALVRGTPQELLRLREVLELREVFIVGLDWVAPI